MNPKNGTLFKRKPIRNFIILPDLQWPYIIRVLALVNLAGVLMATTICALFYLRYQSSPVADSEQGMEMVNENMMGALVEENLMDVVIPAFVISDVVSLLIGLWLALYFSRKVSVPIYRVRKWAEVINTGDLSYRLKFRPGDDLKMLEDACNQVSETYSSIIDDLRRQLSEADLPASPRLQKLKSTLERLRT
jgi:nitrogen fixation/metabolism regulation signal transduction histidine kinase